jgi:hypothetical protein
VERRKFYSGTLYGIKSERFYRGTLRGVERGKASFEFVSYNVGAGAAIW